jgi:hypothetical protein
MENNNAIDFCAVAIAITPSILYIAIATEKFVKKPGF